MFSYEKHFSSDVKESIINDYDLLLSMYHPDDIKEINNDEQKLNFILKINYEINLQSSEVIEGIKRIKLKQINFENDELSIPYWIQFDFDINKNELIYTFSIFWIKDNGDIINNIKQELENIEEPFIYNAIDIIKNNLENTLNEDNIVSFLNDIKINNPQNLSLENALFTITKANKDCPDFLYEEKEESNNNENNENKKEIKEINDKIKNDNISEYDLFFKNGGIKTDILVEKDYAFQCHGIKVKTNKEIDIYKNYLLSNNKIKKATRNVFAFRYKDENSGNIIEDYDDDGEHYAGTRILGYLQKIKIYDILILVSRFNGDLHLKQHSTKYLTIAELLIKQNKDLFKYE
mgnify:FL=1